MPALLASYPTVTATEAGAHFGRVLDQAQRGPVTITRRGEAFVLVHSADYEAQLASAGAPYPRLTLEQLLAGYDPAEHRSDWPDDAPRGVETL